jgi:uncharacterized membrane protein
MKLSRHSLLLLVILLLGTGLRFWNLDFKPLWLDETITALFSLGRSFEAVPLDQAFPLFRLSQVFALNPETTCNQIAETVATQSVHPPLFFCWMHGWLVGIDAFSPSWVWKLRSLPALVGVVAIAALYQLNRIAFSPKAGLMGAALMAVSPFAVYLSQEARHYTLPMLLVILALTGLYQLQTDLYQQRLRPAIWLGWIAVNSLGFYVHYFFLLAFVAQVVTLTVNFLSFKYLPTLHPAPHTLRPYRSLSAIALATAGVCLTYLPWLPTLVSHISRPETDWLKLQESNWADAIAPLYQIPMGWILMFVALPVEQQPTWIAILSGAAMLLFSGWLISQLIGRFGHLWSAPETHLATRLLVIFILVVLLEFLIIIYLLGKDITLVPRYNFIYFPAVCALLGASLIQPASTEKAQAKRGRGKEKRRREETETRRILPFNIKNSILNILQVSPPRFQIPPLDLNRSVVFWVLLVGVISSVFVVSNQVFLKPYHPDLIARNMQVDPEMPLLVGMGYSDFQDVALGLSFGLALQKQNSLQLERKSSINFAFLGRSQSYGQVLQKLSRLKHSLAFPLNFWFVAPGLRQADYPDRLALAGESAKQECNIDPTQYHRLGVPYQMYRCGKEKKGKDKKG